MTEATTEPAGATEKALAARLTRIQTLRTTGGPHRPLAEQVQRELQRVWEHGGLPDEAEPGPKPERILIRPGLIWVHPDDPRGPTLPRLVKSRGLQLRLLLLLLFDAQCRVSAGKPARNVRSVNPGANDAYPSWRELVLSETTPASSTGRGSGALRGRQITEALGALENEHLLSIARRVGGRRDYNEFTLFSEASTATEQPHYLVPERGIGIPREFFTNLWVFALTDAELATYLLLCFLRNRFPSKHHSEGVFLAAHLREQHFRITRATWRSTDLLHRFQLIDRMPDPGRNFRTGKIGDIGRKWAHREVSAAKFKINDDALARPALDVVHQVLAEPTPADQFRRRGLLMDSGEDVNSASLAASLMKPTVQDLIAGRGRQQGPELSKF